MNLEATLTYVVALAVPVWLVVEQIVSARRSRRQEAVPPARRAVAEPAAASHADSASGELRRKAA